MSALDHNGIFWRRLFRSIAMWDFISPIGLAVVQNCNLSDVLDALRELEAEELVWRTKVMLTTRDADLRQHDTSLRQEVNHLPACEEGEWDLIENVRAYRKTENWDAFYTAWMQKNGGTDASVAARTVERAGPLRHRR